MKILNKLSLGVLSLLFAASCQSGLEYDEVPESYYSNVGLDSRRPCTVKARELFKDQIYAKNWDRWVEGYINTVEIGVPSSGTKEWTNPTNQTVTLNGVSVAPGEKVTLRCSITTETLASAPDGQLYVVNLYADSKVTYSSPGKTYFFDSSKFSEISNYIGLVNPDADNPNRATQVTMGVRTNDIIVEMNLDGIDTQYNCNVYPQDGAPALGTPGDYTQPRRYLVENIGRRPDGKESAKRLYEIRITFLPY